MNMKTEIVVLGYSHYNMNDNKGLSIQILGGEVNTNNERGQSITRSEVKNYEELNYLNSLPLEAFPGRFSAEMELGKKKDRSGKEITAAIFSNLNFINSLELVDKKDKKQVS